MKTKIIQTKNGLRLSQHGVVISEMRLTPGPTHSVFDALAALIAVFQPLGRVGLLGFAGGGMMAPLRKLGIESTIHAVDLDATGFKLFDQHCKAWTGGLNWERTEASSWLQKQPRHCFNLLIEDLSIPEGGDVFKPSISWNVLPELIQQRLAADGVAIFNLLKPANGRWNPPVANIVRLFATARIIRLDEFENLLLVAGKHLPSARALSAALRAQLRALRSRQAGRVHVSTT